VEIELADAVASVREELLDAVARRTEAELEFVVGSVELEFSVELRRDAKMKSGFKAWVVSGAAEGGLTHGRTQKVKVTMTPRAADGADLLVAGDRTRPEGPGDVSGRVGR